MKLVYVNCSFIYHRSVPAIRLVLVTIFSFLLVFGVSAQCNLGLNLVNMGTPCAGRDTFNLLGGGTMYQIVWQNGSSGISTLNYVYNRAGVTVAGQGSVFGSTPSLLNSPSGVWVDANDYVYVADKGNNRVQRWAPNATSGVTIAGDPNGTAGSAANQLSSPVGLFMDNAGNLYIADEGNNRVQRWAPNATSGVTVAGDPTGVGGTAANQLNQPLGVWIDATGNLFVSDQLNHRVQKWAPSATSGVTVAGVTGVSGLGGAYLNTPAGITVDGGGNLYIADAANNRVQKWAPAATRGYTVAGDSMGNTGFFNNKLWYPYGVFLDAANNLYIADGSNNRIQKWAPGASQGSTVAGSHYGAIGSNDSLFNFSLSIFVKDSQIFIADFANQRVQRWGPSIATTFIPPGPGYYSAIATAFNGCVDTSIVIFVDSIITPAIGVQASRTSLCGASLDTFTVSTFSGGGLHPNFQWFKNGSLVGSGRTYTASNINDGDSIWAVITTSSACYTTPTAPSNKIYMTVRPVLTPTALITATSVSMCGTVSDTFTANVTNGGTAPVYQWYVNHSPVGSSLLTYINSGPSNNDSIWMTMTTNAVCASSPIIASNVIQVVVGQHSTPTISIHTSATSICGVSIDTFNIATMSGGGNSPIYQWYRNGQPISTLPMLITSSLHDNDSLWLVMTTSDRCATATTATSQTIRVNVRPMVTPSVAITATATAMCGVVSDTFTSFTVNGGSTPGYQWYINHVPVGAHVSRYITNALNDNDSIWLVMTSSATCATVSTVSSNAIRVSVGSFAAPSVTVTTVSDTVCDASPVTFTATCTNGGNNPLYQWKRNGNIVAISPVYTANPLYTGDVVMCVLTSNARCITQYTANSNSHTMTVNPVPVVTVDVIGHTNLCPGDSLALLGLGGTHYQWSTTESTARISVRTTGSYILTVTNSFGCSAISSPVAVTVFSVTAPVVSQSGNLLNSTPAASYQWYWNGNTILFDTNQVHTIIHGGQYTVETVDANGCKSESAPVNLAYAAGIDDLQSDMVRLYPNPNAGRFTIDFADNVERSLSLTDAEGRVVLDPQTVSVMKEFDIRNLADGIYFLQIQQGTQSRTMKITLSR